MHRNNLINKLNHYRTQSAKEAQKQQEMLNFINENANCFERTNLAGHITASAWLLNPDGKKVLLTHHKKLNMWLQLGGHADGESDVLKVALKEAQEESGINEITIVDSHIFDIDIHLIPAIKNDPPHYHYDVRFVLQAAHENYIVSDESNELAWLSFADILDPSTNIDISVKRMAQKSLF